VSLKSIPVARNSSVNPPEERETGSGGSGSAVFARARKSRNDSSMIDVTDRPDSAAVDFTSRYRSSGSCKVVFTYPRLPEIGYLLSVDRQRAASRHHGKELCVCTASGAGGAHDADVRHDLAPMLKRETESSAAMDENPWDALAREDAEHICQSTGSLA